MTFRTNKGDKMITPTGDRIIVKRDENTNQTSSGLLLPTDNEKANTGVVIAVGNLEENITKDDRIVFPRYGGQAVTLKGEEFLILRESEIFGILKDEG